MQPLDSAPKDRRGELAVVGGAVALGRVGEHGLAEAGRLRQLDVPADGRLVDLRPGPSIALTRLLEEAVELGPDLAGEQRVRLVHAQHDAGHPQRRVDALGALRRWSRTACSCPASRGSGFASGR